MRGRTNVMQRPSVTVNGDVVNANVYGTEAIEIGDFVEWNVAYADEQLFLRTDATAIYTKDIDENYKAVIYSNGYLDVWDKNNVVLNSSIYFEEHGVIFGIVLSNKDIIVVTSQYSASGGTGSKDFKFHYVKNNNGLITLLNTTTISMGIWTSSIGILDSTHFCTFTVPDSGNAKITTFTFNTSTGVVTKGVETSGSVGVSFSSSDNRSYIQSEIVNLSDNKILLIFSRYYSSTNRCYGAIISFSGSSYTWSLVSNLTLANRRIFKVIEISTNNYMVFCTTSTINTYDYCLVVSVENNALVINMADYGILSLAKTTFSDSYLQTLIPLCLLEDNTILFVSANGAKTTTYYAILKYDSTSGSVSILDFINSESKYGIFAYFGTLNDIAIVRYENNYYYQYHIAYENEEITGAADRTKAKKYSGGKAIGFAKTGGSVGSRIQIYIPYNS